MLGRTSWASQAVRLYVATGLLKRPKTCQRCGVYGVRILAHHEDYSRPHDVIWLCDKCHRWMHELRFVPMRDEWEMPLSIEPGLEVYRGFRHRMDVAPVEESPDYSRLYAALDKLSYREREFIKLRYGIGDGYTYTLEEVGRRFRVSRERVRQIEAKALRKLFEYIARRS